MRWQSDKAVHIFKASLFGQGIPPERSTSRAPRAACCMLAPAMCPSARLPVSVLGPAGRWVVGVEDELSSGEGGRALGQGKARSWV